MCWESERGRGRDGIFYPKNFPERPRLFHYSNLVVLYSGSGKLTHRKQLLNLKGCVSKRNCTRG